MLTFVFDSHHTTCNKIDIEEKSPHMFGKVLVRHRHHRYSSPHTHILHIPYKNERLKVHSCMRTFVIDSHHTAYNKIDIVEKSPGMTGNVLVRHRQHRYSSSYTPTLYILYKNKRLKVHSCMLSFIFYSHHTTYNKIDIEEKSPHRMGNLLVRHSALL